MKDYNSLSKPLNPFITERDIYKHMARKAMSIPYKNPRTDFKSLLSDLENHISTLEREKDVTWDFAGGGPTQKHALTWGEQRRLDEQKGKKPQELKGGVTEEEKQALAELDQIIALLEQEKKQLEQVWINVQRELSKMDDDSFSPLSIIASIAVGALTAGLGNMVFGSATLASLPANFITNLTNSSTVISSLAGTANQLSTKAQLLAQEDKLNIENLLKLITSYTQEIHNLKSTRYDVEINAKVQDLKNKAQQQINALSKPLSQNEINSIATNVQQQHQQLNNQKTAFQAQERYNWLLQEGKKYGGTILGMVNGKQRAILDDVHIALSKGTPILNLISNPIFTEPRLYAIQRVGGIGAIVSFYYDVPLPPATIIHAPLPTLEQLISQGHIPANRTAAYYNNQVAAIAANRDAAMAQVQREGAQKEQQKLAKIAELEQLIRNKQQELQKAQTQQATNKNNFRDEKALVINKFKQALEKVSKDLMEAQNIKKQKLEQKRVTGVHKKLGKALKTEKARRDEEVIEEARNILFQISPKKYPLDINNWRSNAKHKFLNKDIKYITDNLPNWRQVLENIKEKKRLAEEQRVAEEEKVRNEFIDALRRIEPDEYSIDVSVWPADSFGKKVIDSKNYTMMQDILKEIEEGEAEAKKEAERQKQLEIEQQQARIIELEKEEAEIKARVQKEIDELTNKFQKANENLLNELKEQQRLAKEKVTNEIDRLLAEENIDFLTEEYINNRIKTDEFLKKIQKERIQIPNTIEDDEREILRLIEQAEKEQPRLGFVGKQEIPAPLSTENESVIEAIPPQRQEEEEFSRIPKAINRKTKNLQEDMEQALFKKELDRIAQEWENELEDKRERGLTGPNSIIGDEYEKERSEDEELLTPKASIPLELQEMYNPDEYARNLSEELARLEKEQEDFEKNQKALKIQAFFRGKKAREEYVRMSKEREAERLNKINDLRAEREALEVLNLKEFFNGMDKHNWNEKFNQLRTELKSTDLNKELENDPWLAQAEEANLRSLEAEKELFKERMAAAGEPEEPSSSESESDIEAVSDDAIADGEQMQKEMQEFARRLEEQAQKENNRDVGNLEKSKQGNITAAADQARLRLENRQRRALNLENPNYQYEDEDILDLLQDQDLGDNIGINPIVATYGLAESDQVLIDGLGNALGQVFSGEKDKVLLPINLGGYHWISMMMQRIGDEIAIEYNDPLGYPINPLIKNGLESFGIPQHNINDLQIKQQNDDLNCGVMITDNLIRMALDEPIMNTREALEAAPDLREQHMLQVASKIEEDEADLEIKQRELNNFVSGENHNQIDDAIEEEPTIAKNEAANLDINGQIPLHLSNNDEEALLLQEIINEKNKSNNNGHSLVLPSSGVTNSALGKPELKPTEQKAAELKELYERYNSTKDIDLKANLLQTIKREEDNLENLKEDENYRKMSQRANIEQRLKEAQENEIKRLQNLENSKQRTILAREEYNKNKERLGLDNLTILDKLEKLGAPILAEDQDVLNRFREEQAIEERNRILRQETAMEAEQKYLENIEKQIPSPPNSGIKALEETENFFKNFKLPKERQLSPEEITEAEKVAAWDKEDEIDRAAWRRLVLKNNYTDLLNKLKAEKSLAPYPDLPKGLTEDDVAKELTEFAASNPKEKLFHINKERKDPFYRAQFTKENLPRQHEAIENPKVATEINKLYNPKTYERQIQEQDRLNKMEKDIDFLLGGSGRQYEKAEVLHKYEIPTTSASSYNQDRERAILKRYIKNYANKTNHGQQKQNYQWGGDFSGNYGDVFNGNFYGKNRANPLEFFGESKFNPYYYNPSLVYGKS